MEDQFYYRCPHKNLKPRLVSSIEQFRAMDYISQSACLQKLEDKDKEVLEVPNGLDECKEDLKKKGVNFIHEES